ncbi:hypothetical protein SSS_00886 [Sarcoptes scabiei]|nr:hypothetical protein SSS_00886 [Sarcoptes scabiei]
MPFDAQKFQWSELNAFLQYIFAQSNASIQEKFNYLLYMFRMNPQALNLLRNIDSSKPDCLAKALSILNASYNCYESRETNDLLTRIKTAELNFEQASSWDQLLMLALKVKFETNPQTISIYTKQLILRLPDFMFEDPNSPYSLDNLIKVAKTCPKFSSNKLYNIVQSNQVQSYHPDQIQSNCPSHIQSNGPCHIQSNGLSQIQSHHTNQIQSHHPEQAQTHHPEQIFSHHLGQIQSNGPSQIQSKGPSQIQSHHTDQNQFHNPEQTQVHRSEQIQPNHTDQSTNRIESTDWIGSISEELSSSDSDDEDTVDIIKDRRYNISIFDSKSKIATSSRNNQAKPEWTKQSSNRKKAILDLTIELNLLNNQNNTCEKIESHISNLFKKFYIDQQLITKLKISYLQIMPMMSSDEYYVRLGSAYIDVGLGFFVQSIKFEVISYSSKWPHEQKPSIIIPRKHLDQFSVIRLDDDLYEIYQKFQITYHLKHIEDEEILQSYEKQSPIKIYGGDSTETFLISVPVEPYDSKKISEIDLITNRLQKENLLSQSISKNTENICLKFLLKSKEDNIETDYDDENSYESYYLSDIELYYGIERVKKLGLLEEKSEDYLLFILFGNNKNHCSILIKFQSSNYCIIIPVKNCNEIENIIDNICNRLKIET